MTPEAWLHTIQQWIYRRARPSIRIRRDMVVGKPSDTDPPGNLMRTVSAFSLGIDLVPYQGATAEATVRWTGYAVAEYTLHFYVHHDHTQNSAFGIRMQPPAQEVSQALLRGDWEAFYHAVLAQSTWELPAAPQDVLRQDFETFRDRAAPVFREFVQRFYLPPQPRRGPREVTE